jgi:hypothetical protein
MASGTKRPQADDPSLPDRAEDGPRTIDAPYDRSSL